MKLSIKEKAKRYDEALEIARNYHKQLLDEDNPEWASEIEKIFHELKESEDEKIRKALLEMVHDTTSDELWIDYDVHKEDALAWLEKQGEQKEYTFKSLPRLLDMIEPTSKAKAYCQKLIDTLVKEGYAADAKIVGECLKQMNGEKVALATMDEKQAPKTKWTEEDEKVFNNLIGSLIRISHHTFTDCTSPNYTFFTEIEWLKELKQRMEYK